MLALKRTEVIANWPGVLERIQNGETIVVQNEKNAERIAVIMPFAQYQRKGQRPLGLLKGKAHFKIKRNFKMTDKEFLSL